MVKQITVFTRATCAPCKMLKLYLNHKGLSYEEVNIDENPEAKAEAYELAGYSIVPLTIVEKADGTRNIISGYNLQALSSCLS